MAEGKVYLAATIAIICAVVGFAIVDSITADTVSAATVNETVGTANGTGYFSGTLDYTPLSTPIIYRNGTAQTGNVTVAAGSKTVVTANPSANFNDATITAYYNYDDETYLSGSLSRTIITYIVPIGLLFVIGLAAGLSG